MSSVAFPVLTTIFVKVWRSSEYYTIYHFLFFLALKDTKTPCSGVWFSAFYYSAY